MMMVSYLRHRSLLTGLAATAALVATLCGCRDTPLPSSQPARLRIFVSILPQKYFVERVGGDEVQVEALIGPGQNHHTYEITPQQAARLARADAFCRLGLPFEDSLLRKLASAYTNLRIVNTHEDTPWRFTKAEELGDIHAHAHGSDEECPTHHAGELDPHIWLNPRLVKLQAASICRALQELRPAAARRFQENLTAFQADLDALDQRLSAVLAPFRGREFFVFHPAFGYLADAYGLRQVAVETGGKEPSARRLAELITQARSSGTKLIFVQPQFPTRSAEALAREIGGAVVAIDPMAENYIENLESMAAAIASAFADGHSAGNGR